MNGADEREGSVLGALQNALEKREWFRRRVLRPIFTSAIFVYPIWIVVRELGLAPFIDGAAMDRSITVALTLFCAERIISIETLMRRPKTMILPDEAAGFDGLRESLKNAEVCKIDAIQLSGQIALPALTGLLRDHPSADLRLLLLHDSTSGLFDINRGPGNFHARRAESTDVAFTILAKQLERKGATITIRYYKSVPSVCAIIIDDAHVCVSWYRSIMDEKNEMIVSSHDSPSILPTEEAAEPLIGFARRHFDELWSKSVSVS